MAGSITRRARAFAATTIAVVALALAGCGGGDPAPSSSQPGDSQIGGAPTPTATTPSAGGGATPTTGSGGSTSTPYFPKDAKAYAQELLKAWAAKNYTRLNQLAIQSTVQQIRDSVNSGGVPNSQWTNISCGAADTGSTSCLFRNAHGDVATIKLNNTQLGFPTAATEAMLERTVYPSDPGSYAATFMSAWQEGNTQRMARLSSSSIASFFVGQGKALGASSQYTPVDLGSGYVAVQFSGLSDDSGRYYTLKLLASPGGKANAIKAYCATPDCTP
ncbi:MAG TPA: hypothetical protein VF163_03465 [Micromonosporaceae bacterium]